jgi:hypothetical protein
MTRRVYVAVEWRGDFPLAVHTLDLPSITDPGAYPQAKSIEGFRRRMRNQEFSPGRWFRVYLASELEGGLGGHEKATYSYDKLPQHAHTNVFQFYGVIDYDHKRARFIS